MSAEEAVEEASSSSSSPAEKAREWVQMDPNPVTVQYVQELLCVSQQQQLEIDAQNELAKAEAVAELSALFPVVPPTTTTGSSSERNRVCRRQRRRPQPQPCRRIGFGTAGLRARMQPGPLGMNDLTVIQTAQGLAQYCKNQQQQQHTPQPQQSQSQTQPLIDVVVGYDHRAHETLQLSSRQFAVYTALVFREAKCKCLLLDDYVATPMVPFAMQETQAMLGIMVTASHNPKHDAGYKVYWRSDRMVVDAASSSSADNHDSSHNNNNNKNGTGKYACQIRSPMDKEISAMIDDNLTPWIDYRSRLLQIVAATMPTSTTTMSIQSHLLFGLSDPQRTKQLIDRYFETIGSYCRVTEQNPHRSSSRPAVVHSPLHHNHPPSPKVAYTAMHGVGYAFATRLVQSWNLPPLISVPAQQEPDPDFPTVPFPNPEERGALNVALHFAQTYECDVLLANDPDADRLAVAEYSSLSGWTIFTGDQIGTMLGHWLWQQYTSSTSSSASNSITTPKKKAVMLASTVSSQMLATIARVEGFHFEATLSGFKWIGSRAAQLQNTGEYEVLLAYEEALGYACGGPLVLVDKDGIAALGVMYELLQHVYTVQKRTLSHYLQLLYDLYGEFVSRNGYYSMPFTSTSTSSSSSTDDDHSSNGDNDNDDKNMVQTLFRDMLTRIMSSSEDSDSDSDSVSGVVASVGPYPVSRIRALPDTGEPGYEYDFSKSAKSSSSSSASSSVSTTFSMQHLPSKISVLTIGFDLTTSTSTDMRSALVHFRASGTEASKFKYYLEVAGMPGVSRRVVQRELNALASAVLLPGRSSLVNPEQYGLILS